MSKLAQFSKAAAAPKPETTTTSVVIEARQLNFLKSRKINLSALLRDYLESLMTEDAEDRKIL
jgi:hypothetical protein